MKSIIDPHNWEVKMDGTRWVGRLVHYANTPSINRRMPTFPVSGYIDIMPASFPETLAIDAFCDFMSRLNNGIVPRGLTDPRELMDMCVMSARRQR